MEPANVLLLAVDTATEITVVSLMKDEALVAEATRDGKRHSRVLLRLVDGVLKDEGLEPRDIDVLAVGVGPGSFTGVRVGVTFAKTLAVVLGIPLVRVSSLAALAASQPERKDHIVAAVLDALKGQVYAACYDPGRWFDPVFPPAAMVPEALAERLAAIDRPVLMAGSGATRYLQLFKQKLGHALTVQNAPQSHWMNPRALGKLGIQAYRIEGPVDPHSLEPDYCRPSDAELAKKARDLRP